jgi:hypothetical protein
MENKFTPENIALTAVKGVAEATPPVINLVVALGVPFLRAFTWGDEVVKAQTTSHAARMVSGYMRAQTQKREVKHS